MISAVILAKNEASNIKAVIESVSFCDEVLVVDDNSTDQTKEIAQPLGAKVILAPETKSFAKKRNSGLEKARHEWVLFVDADEVISTQLAQEIVSVVKNDQCVAYQCHRNDFFLGKALRFGETASVSFVRLAKKGVGKWERPVHEVWSVKGEVGILENPLIHQPHPDLNSFLEKIDKYTSIEASHRNKKGVSFQSWQILVYPIAKFIQNYFFRLGILDGFPGLIMAYMMSLHSLIVRIKLYEANHKNI